MTDKKHVRRKWDGCFFSWHIIFHLSNAIPLTRLPATAHPSKFWLWRRWGKLGTDGKWSRKPHWIDACICKRCRVRVSGRETIKRPRPCVSWGFFLYIYWPPKAFLFSLSHWPARGPCVNNHTVGPRVAPSPPQQTQGHKGRWGRRRLEDWRGSRCLQREWGREVLGGKGCRKTFAPWRFGYLHKLVSLAANWQDSPPSPHTRLLFPFLLSWRAGRVEGGRRLMPELHIPSAPALRWKGANVTWT